jgi:hypothetical protein
MNNIETVTYEIKSNRLEDAIAKITTINKKAKKNALAPIQYEVGEPLIRNVPYNDHRVDPLTGKIATVPIEYTPVTISIDIVKIEGWNFRAVIECVTHKDGKPENVISGPQAERFAEYRDATNKCDHCGINRYRKQTYILEHDDGNLKQVGSTCLKDYLGVDPQKAIAGFQYSKQLRAFFDDDCGGAVEFTADFKDVISATLAWIREDGRYIKSGNNGDGYENVPTWSKVYDEVFSCHAVGHEFVKQVDVDRAEIVYAELYKTFEKVNALPDTKTADDFEYKIYLLIKLGRVREARRHFAVAVGATAGANYRLIKDELEAQRKARLTLGDADHFGTEKVRGEFELTIEKVAWKEGEYGTYALIRGRQTGTNNVFVWFATGDVSDFIDNDDAPIADSFKVKATVKKHEDNPKYGKSTIVNRVKIVK